MRLWKLEADANTEQESCLMYRFSGEDLFGPWPSVGWYFHLACHPRVDPESMLEVLRGSSPCFHSCFATRPRKLVLIIRRALPRLALRRFPLPLYHWFFSRLDRSCEWARALRLLRSLEQQRLEKARFWPSSYARSVTVLHSHSSSFPAGRDTVELNSNGLIR